jgi:hypothetical protein
MGLQPKNFDFSEGKIAALPTASLPAERRRPLSASPCRRRAPSPGPSAPPRELAPERVRRRVESSDRRRISAGRRAGAPPAAGAPPRASFTAAVAARELCRAALLAGEHRQAPAAGTSSGSPVAGPFVFVHLLAELGSRQSAIVGQRRRKSMRPSAYQPHFSPATNQPPATSQQYFSLRTNQHQLPATSQPNRLMDRRGIFASRFRLTQNAWLVCIDRWRLF